MPYQTGVAANPADLKTAIENFAVARGWSLSSGVLSKGGSYIRLTDTGASDLKVQAALDAGFASVAPQAPHINIPSGWPVTYHLFGFTDVDNIYCVVNYNVSRYQYLAFGHLLKYGTWTGGTWISGTCANSTNTLTSMLISGNTIQSSYPGSPPAHTGGGILTWGTNGTGAGNENSMLHVEVDGNVWLDGWQNHTFWASVSPGLSNLINRLPNTWNSQAVLLPYHVAMNRASNKRTLLGEIPHIRMTRVDNHEPGDVITLGAEQWKLFPWLEKDSTQRNGLAGSFHSGTSGWAIKYDGP